MSSSSHRTSRYLRAAPRPNEWEDMEESVLAQLGSNAEKSLVLTLQQLREVYGWQPKKGPGRKSNAEHAIHFYEYLLEKVRREKADKKGSDNDNSNEENDNNEDNHSQSNHSNASSPTTSAKTSTVADEETETEVEGESPKTTLRNLPKNETTNEEDDEGGDLDKEEEATAVDDPMPKNNNQEETQHDKCDVCYQQKENERLLKCTTCPQVFHLDCYRPVLDEFPSDMSDWRCSYCILTSEPKNTRNRRVSAAAVRLMARLRNGLKRKRSKERKPPEGDVVSASAPKEEIEAAPVEEEEDSKMPAKKPPPPKEEEEAKSLAGKEGEDDGRDQQDDDSVNEGEEDEKEEAMEIDEQDEEASDEETENEEEEQKSDEDNANESEEEKEKTDASEKVNKEDSGGREEAAGEQQQQAKEVASGTDAKDEEAKDKKTPAKEQTAESGGDPSSGGSRRRAIELSRLTDAWTSQMESPDDGIGRRSRKQPTLYDPQLVSARKWMSDEVNQSDAETESEEGSKAGAPQKKKGDGDECATKSEDKPGDGETKSGEVKCYFCSDDPTIPLCCFCACRVCMVKRDKDKLLTCSECSDLYHIHCLDPPLSAKPAENKPWSCPSCSRVRSPKPPPRTPAKSKSSKPASQSKNARSSSSRAKRPVGRPPSSNKQKKRPVGRPPKSKSRSPSPSRKSSRTPAAIAAAAATAAPTLPIKRKRGRPPKNPKAIAAAAAAAAAEAAAAAKKSTTGRKRGRPPKVRPEPEPPAKKPKPFRAPDGRFMSPPKEPSSKKSETKEKVSPEHEVLTSVAPATVVSRSGRTVKRSSFHDELPEGEQHLKSYRQQAAWGSQTNKKSQVSAKRTPSVQRAAIKQAPATKSRAEADDEIEDAVVDDPMEVEEVQAESDPGVRSRSIATSQTLVSVDQPVVSASARRGSYPPTAQVAAASAVSDMDGSNRGSSRGPRRKPGARECMQISRRFGVNVIPKKYIDILTDYCNRGKVEHLVRMRSRLDEHSQFLEAQLAGLETLIKLKGESNVVVPALPEQPDRRLDRTFAGEE